MNVFRAAPRITQSMRDFLARKRTEEKVARDVLRVGLYARGYIEIGEDGKTQNAYLRPDGPLPVIAVVGQVEEGLGVVLEIGLHRTTPYTTSECAQEHRAHVGRTIPSRERVRQITPSELLSVYPVLTQMFEDLIIRQRSGWKRREAWWVRTLSHSVHKGIGIRIDRTDTLMYRQVLLEDIRLREHYITSLRLYISSRLRGYKYAYGYTKKELRSYANASRVAAAFTGERKVPLHLSLAARRALGAKKGSKLWTLCEEIMGAYEVGQVDEHALEVMEELLYSPQMPTFPPFVNFGIRIEEERNEKYRHGQGCVTAELVPTKTFVDLVELPKEMEAAGGDTSCHDDDVPF